jgi:hypothetical protein
LCRSVGDAGVSLDATSVPPSVRKVLAPVSTINT